MLVQLLVQVDDGLVDEGGGLGLVQVIGDELVGGLDGDVDGEASVKVGREFLLKKDGG